jgi:hypothetical protein
MSDNEFGQYPPLPQYHELTVDTDGIEGDVDAHNTIFGGQAKMIREIHRNKFG